jgi:hypothetical protein
MYCPRGHALRRMGLAIAILTLGGVLSFGLGQALGHGAAHSATQAHSAPGIPQQQATAGSSLTQQPASVSHIPALALPPQPASDSHDQHNGDDKGRKDHRDSPPPKADGNSGGNGGNNGGG